MGWNDVSDSTYLKFVTPNLDNLAAQGISLSRHYTAWVCGPTRASLLTGRYAYRLGFSQDPDSDPNLPLNGTLLIKKIKLQF